MANKLLALLAVVLLGSCGWIIARNPESNDNSVELLNISYDATRKLWEDINAEFIPHYEAQSGKKTSIIQSNGGSASQARNVIGGLEADVVTLALWSDTDIIRKYGLIADGWEERLPNRSLPYYSTIVFVVRKGNPKGIRDWPDLIRPGMQVITPNPKTSGNGKLSFLGAWGSVVLRGKSPQEAMDFVTKLYSPEHIPVLESGAASSAATFAQKKIGDVHLTWESEAWLEIEKMNDELEIVYPPISIRAEPYVAMVDANVTRKRTQEAAEAYLQFLFTDQVQEIFAKHHFRPINSKVLMRHADDFPSIELFSITAIAENWDDANRKFFGSNGVFDRIYRSNR